MTAAAAALPAAGATHVHVVTSSRSTDDLVGDLSEAEQAVAVRRPYGGRQFAIARCAIRSLVSGHASWSASEVDISRRCPSCRSSSHGAPVVDDAYQATFSVAHSADFVVVAVTRGTPDSGARVGVDVEDLQRRVRLQRPSASFFHPEEICRIEAAGDLGAQHRELLRLWCRKEAALKAVGVGLARGTSHVNAAGDIVVVGVAGVAATFDVRDVHLNGAAAAVAVRAGTAPATVRSLVV